MELLLDFLFSAIGVKLWAVLSLIFVGVVLFFIWDHIALMLIIIPFLLVLLAILARKLKIIFFSNKLLKIALITSLSWAAISFGALFVISKMNSPMIITNEMVEKFTPKAFSNQINVFRKSKIYYQAKDIKVRFENGKINISAILNGEVEIPPTKFTKKITKEVKEVEILVNGLPDKKYDGIYLRDFEIVSLGKFGKDGKVSEIVEDMLNTYFEKKPIYQYRNWKERFARDIVKEIQIEDGQLRLLTIFD